MGRRSDHSREELYGLAVGAAGGLVEQGGYRSLTARGVAEAIGYSVGTLYNLFEDIDDLVLHLNGRTLGELHGRLAAVKRGGEAVADVQALVRAYIAFTESHPALWNALFEHRLPEGRALPDWYRAKVAAVLEQLEEAMAPLFGPGKEPELTEAARLLWASLHGICSLAAQGKLEVVTGRSVEQMADNLTVDYLAGLRLRFGS